MNVSNNARYDAFWVPGLDDEIDPDDALDIAVDWLSNEERSRGGAGVIVMYAKQMMGNRPLLGQAASRWEFVSPRSRSHGWPHGQGPVLCVWPPDDKTLELAEQLAFGSALCVIPGSLYDITGWVARTDAKPLVAGAIAREIPALSTEVREELESLAWFGGHNAFLGGGEKERAIRTLHELARRPDRPSREAVETFLRSCSEVHRDGASRVGKWYDEVLAGKRHRDYAGRVI
jgi:hypothetical protein